MLLFARVKDEDNHVFKEYVFISRIELPLCGATIIVPKIKTTSLLVNNITVKSLNSTSVFGDLGEEYLTHNATFLFKPLDRSIGK